MMDAAEFQRIAKVPQEVFDDYQEWSNLLTHWNKKINLVSASTVSNFWLRHALDSFQLTQFIPAQATTILDMGSGAGFPGLAFAIHAGQMQNGQHVTLVESNGKKCNFLRAVIRALDLPATVLQARAENMQPKPYDVITARAFAPLPKLLGYSTPFWTPNTLGIYPKGERWQDEVKAAQKQWRFTFEAKDSQTDEAAKILLVSGLKRVNTRYTSGENT